LAGIALAVATPAWGQGGGELPSSGVWRNPQDSVHISLRGCGDALCGTVIWANDKAQADARRGGTDPLVGVDLFRNFRAAGPGVWRGRVFVPDLNKSFSGTLTRVDERTLIGKGCLIGRIGCRSQTWRRVE
jgi:uncharacterized protein (DUF2147 family)